MLTIEVETEADDRWLAEVPELPGALAYGLDRAEAVRNVKVLAMQILTDRIAHGEPVPDVQSLFREKASI